MLQINDKVLFRDEKCIIERFDNTYSIQGIVLRSEKGYKIICFDEREIKQI